MITNCPVALFFRNSDIAKEGRHQSILSRRQYTCNIQKKNAILISISLDKIWLEFGCVSKLRGAGRVEGEF